MTASLTPAEHHRIQTTMALAQLLERVERQPGVLSAGQYRALVRQLAGLLAKDLPAAAREAILRRSPAAAQLYENLHYPVAGLSRSPLEAATRAELAARELLERLARTGPGAHDPGAGAGTGG